ncbi:MAG: glycosyltransferase family 2 protein [Patescibacteria group bacterium]
MKLSVLITHFKTPDLLRLCLNSINSTTANLEKEIIVLDSAADSETEEWLINDFPAAKYRAFKKNLGYAKMINIGLTQARGDFILILNADLIVEKGAIEKMLDFMLVNTRVGLVAPRLLNFNGTVQDSCFRWHHWLTVIYRRTWLGLTRRGKRELERFIIKISDSAASQAVDWVLGAAMLVRQSAVTQVGLMDERFFLYFEDTDWCRRFWLADWQVVYLTEALMHHYHGRLSKRTSGLADIFFNRYTWIHIVSALKYFWKYRGQSLSGLGKKQ